MEGGQDLDPVQRGGVEPCTKRVGLFKKGLDQGPVVCDPLPHGQNDGMTDRYD